MNEAHDRSPLKPTKWKTKLACVLMYYVVFVIIWIQINNSVMECNSFTSINAIYIYAGIS